MVGYPGEKKFKAITCKFSYVLLFGEFMFQASSISERELIVARENGFLAAYCL